MNYSIYYYKFGSPPATRLPSSLLITIVDVLTGNFILLNIKYLLEYKNFNSYEH
jgi:hypothetical protein